MLSPSMLVKGNRLLNELEVTVQSAWLPQLKLISLVSGTDILTLGQKPQYVYFPITCILSMMADLMDGHSLQSAQIGYDGVAGLETVLGDGVTQNTIVVQSSGLALQLPANEFRRQFHDNLSVRKLVLSYTQQLIHQVAQTSSCYRHHLIEQQLSRWLLSTLDLTPSGSVDMTQEFISHLLGVRRVSIGNAAGHLQALGGIELKRGKLIIQNRSVVEKQACECYQSQKVCAIAAS